MPEQIRYKKLLVIVISLQGGTSSNIGAGLRRLGHRTNEPLKNGNIL